MTATWGPGARRRALAVLAALGLLASLITVFSPPALGKGSSPSVECSSTNPAWNGDYWKVENDDGTLSEVETNVTGAITFAANGSWTNNNEDPVFRVVLKIDDDDEEDPVVLSGIWETGEGGTIDMTLGLDHVTFCSTSEVSEGSEPTTTTTASTTTTSTSSTTTTSAGPTITTSPDASTAPIPGESTTTAPSDETTTIAAANPTEVSDSGLASDASQADESVEEADGSEVDSHPSPDADRDTTGAGLMNAGPEEPPALGQELSSEAVPFVFRGPNPWTLADLAILGALIAAIAALLERRRLRRLVGHLGKRWR